MAPPVVTEALEYSTRVWKSLESVLTSDGDIGMSLREFISFSVPRHQGWMRFAQISVCCGAVLADMSVQHQGDSALD